ncbi:MAG: class I SAM-dependent DNA methyltransferase [Bacteroidia bacterium]
MNIAQIENNLQDLIKVFKKESFIYDLLIAYGQPNASIKRIKDGGMNLSKVEGEISWKKKLFFKEVNGVDLHELIAELTSDSKTMKHNPRFVVVTDYITILAIDTKTQDSLDIALADIVKHYDFFLPWAGMEKAQHQNENPADVRAAEKMAKLYDDIKKDNPITTNLKEEQKAEIHNLNVFLSRLLFCFFAEDTGIFEKQQFTYAIGSHTQQDGSDLNIYLDHLFEVLNTADKYRNNLPAYLLAFPYVNGGLFRNRHNAPIFTRKSRQSLIDSGGLEWSAINPDIFGSMIQAVITPEQRGGLGMHYTSVPNIMKVIEPLFLNELYEELEAAKGNKKKLIALLNRIWSIKIFDPACGSGNFLIIAYKELRKLEIAIIKEYDRVKAINSGFAEIQQSLFQKAQLRLGDNDTSILQFDSKIKLSQFYGIELDDFAHEVAILSLWLAEHQMNQVFLAAFGRCKPALPLTETGNIVHGNACRLDWESVCPKGKGDEIYILGNPPYLGARILDDVQKDDMKFVFNGKVEGYNDLDYIAPWFFKGGKYIENVNAKCAFVSTNSICQGSQVAKLWPNILADKLEIDYVHQSFKWTNNAKAKAAVIVIILGIRNISNKPKFIFNKTLKTSVRNISPYLVEGDNVYVFGRRNQLSKVPSMNFGSMPNDGGYLTLTPEEYKSLIEQDSNSKKYIKKLTGSKEFINDIERWCIWIENGDVKEASQIKFIKGRIEKVKLHREKSDRVATNVLAAIPHRFAEVRYKNTNSIVVPSVSSNIREYHPIGFLDQNTIVTNLAFTIYTEEIYFFTILCSKMHNVWINSVSGRLGVGLRYSATLSYNTFPLPDITESQKKELEIHVYKILEEREHHSEKTLAQLYDPDKMPDGLRKAHHQLDLAVERCYRAKPFESDEERLEYLFKLYEQMIAEEKRKGSLFETEVKPKKQRK